MSSVFSRQPINIALKSIVGNDQAFDQPADRNVLIRIAFNQSVESSLETVKTVKRLTNHLNETFDKVLSVANQ